ncbi:GyrI-like domain-containing protein [Shewanella kaireitica]|nr:GyrI-like domain-containing protein [Shewanella kaireitica]
MPGGRLATTRHLGSHQQMDNKIYQFYREWLPTSGENLRDFPLFFHYVNLFPEVSESNLITDIYFALKDNTNQYKKLNYSDSLNPSSVTH